jgi:signal transduction histidine kinase
MARCESGAEEIRWEILELDPVVRSAWKPFAALADRRKITVSIQIPDTAIVRSDRTLLHMMLVNFLANAAEYTPEHGRICISTSAEPSATTLQIANSVSDLTPEDLPHVFSRFWRKTASRTSSNRAGLGLSISQAMAHLLETPLSAVIPEPGIFCISLTLPSASSATLSVKS